MAKRKKLTIAERLENEPFENLIRGMDEKSLRKFISSARRSHTIRLKEISKAGEVSQAQIQYDARGKRLATSKMNWNQLVLELAKETTFFKAETASLEGIRRVNRDQDARIFGTDEKGDPVRTMSAEERKRYWELYEEFQRSKPVSSRYGSSSEQRMLAEAMVEASSTDNIVDILNRTAEKLRAENNLTRPRSAFNVYSGTGDDFTS